MKRFLVTFNDQEAIDSHVVGQKFVSLAVAHRNGFEVPEAVAIRTDAHQHYIRHRQWPEGLMAEVSQIAKELDLASGLSIRSSSTQEDLENQSFAGQYRTFLEVVTEADLEKNIQKCWLSAETEIVKTYLHTDQNDSIEFTVPLMGVVLQKMVYPIASGVAFGRNPMFPARNEIVIEGVKGLSEKLVSGHTTPHRIFIQDNGHLQIVAPTRQQSVKEDQKQPLLPNQQWLAIGQLLKNLESVSTKRPLDIEWAVDAHNKLWLLQSRPITGLSADDLTLPTGIWTRKIANDLWADRLTPFLADIMLANAPYFDLSTYCKIIGIPFSQPNLAVIKGYLYINGDSIQASIGCIPKNLRSSALLSFLPPGTDSESIAQPSFLQTCLRVLRISYLLFTEPRSNPIFCLWLSRRDQEKVARNVKHIAQMRNQTTAQTLSQLNQALDNLRTLQINNQWPYFFASFFMLFQRWLMVDIARLSHTDFLQLISTGGHNVTIEIESEIRKIADKICANETLRARFKRLSAQELAEDIPTEIRSDFQAFLARYGCRARHRTLVVKRWAEAPHEVMALIQSLVQQSEAGHEKMHLSAHSERQALVNRVGTVSESHQFQSTRHSGWNASWLPRTLFRFINHGLLRLTRKFLDFREELRFILDKALFQIRQILLKMGDQTGLGANTLFLTRDDLEYLINGRLSQEAAQKRAIQRCHDFSKPTVSYPYYLDGKPIADKSDNSKTLKGIGTSPGRHTGKVQIVEDPTTINVQKGDVVVARNTDPGWTPILSTVGGLVIEEGGLLNHCSIVARELGIPTVVGVHNATEKITNGTIVTVDGGLGTVNIEENRDGV